MRSFGRSVTTCRAVLVLGCALLPVARGAQAQAEFFSAWQARVAATQAEQPHWITPLVTVTPRLEQEWRSDFVFQSQPNGKSTFNYGNGKGLELIPEEHVEVILGVPPYFEHNNSKSQSGFGDVNFLVKYRLLAANEDDGNYILTAFLGASAPTGNHDNSAREAIFTPTIAFGKGWSGFDVQGTLASRIPGGDFDRLGTPIVSNTAFQYLVVDHVWPEFEVNLTTWPNGDNSGKTEVFLTPGLVVGRLPLWERLGLTLGAGVQIAATHFRSANHNWIISIRLPF
jgi:hypothetical protein